MQDHEPAVLLLGPARDDRAEFAAALGTAISPGSGVFRVLAPGGDRVRLVVGPDSGDLLADEPWCRGLMAAVDALAVFVPATGRVDAASAGVANAAMLPVVLVLTHLDHERADPAAAVEASRALLDQELVLAQLPVFGTDDRVAAVLDLLSLEVLEPGVPARPADPEHSDAVAEEHEALVGEVLAAGEDGLEAYLDGAPADPARLRELLAEAVEQQLLTPAVCLAPALPGPGHDGAELPGGAAVVGLLSGVGQAPVPRIIDTAGEAPPAEPHSPPFGLVLGGGVVQRRWGRFADEPLLAGGLPARHSWTAIGDLVVTGPGVATGAVVCRVADPLWLAE